MNIAIIGVTGRIGKRVARELLERGHEVVGINRRPERVGPVLNGLPLQSISADAQDAEAIARAVSGVEAVLMATAPTREHPTRYLDQCRNVIAATRRAGVGRLVAMSYYKALRAPDGRPMLEAEPPHPQFRAIEAVQVEAVSLFEAERGLDWLLVAPPAELFPYGERTTRFRVGTGMLVVTEPVASGFQEVSRLSMEDLAYFVADELEGARYHRELVTLGY